MQNQSKMEKTLNISLKEYEEMQAEITECRRNAQISELRINNGIQQLHREHTHHLTKQLQLTTDDLEKCKSENQSLKERIGYLNASSKVDLGQYRDNLQQEGLKITMLETELAKLKSKWYVRLFSLRIK